MRYLRDDANDTRAAFVVEVWSKVQHSTTGERGTPDDDTRRVYTLELLNSRDCSTVIVLLQIEVDDIARLAVALSPVSVIELSEAVSCYCYKPWQQIALTVIA